MNPVSTPHAPHAPVEPLLHPGEGEPGTTREHHEHHELSFLRRYIFSEDHKVIGLQFLFSGMLFLVLGGLMAMAIRFQLAWPWEEMPVIGRILFPNTGRVISPEFYTMLFTMHGTIMIFFVIIPLLTGAFGNFLIPLMIGAPDMAFPKLNMFGYWAMIPAIVCALTSFALEGGGPAAGWTAYPPLSTIEKAAPGSMHGQTFWLLALTFVGASSMMGAVNYVTTIVKMRAPGLTMMRLPLSIWALFVAALLQLFALPVLTAASIMQVLDRVAHTGFFTPTNLLVNQLAPEQAGAAAGGQPLLWQHLFWFYSHPAVYIMVVPAMGFASDILSTHARKPLFGYKPMVYSIMAIAGLGFIVWGHHMFMSGMNPALGMTFMVSTILIALPSCVKVFNWLATIWGGRIQFTTPMLFSMGFVSMFIIGGLSGLFMAATPVDIHIHDTYIIVAHFHYVVFGGTLLATLGAVHYWYPLMFGRMMSERLGKLHFVLTFVAFNCTFFPMHTLGQAGMPRRYADFTQIESLQHLQGVNRFVSISAFVMGASQLIFVFNFMSSLWFGKKADSNPWKTNTIEWDTPRPIPHGNWGPDLPLVYRPPYEYASPEVTDDYLPQTKRIEKNSKA